MANVVTLYEQTTGQIRNYGAAPTGTFNFANVPPGVYTLINSSASSITVSLFGQPYVVPAHSRWHFDAHLEIASVAQAKGAKPNGQQRITGITEGVPTDVGIVPGYPSATPGAFG